MRVCPENFILFEYILNLQRISNLPLYKMKYFATDINVYLSLYLFCTLIYPFEEKKITYLYTMLPTQNCNCFIVNVNGIFVVVFGMLVPFLRKTLKIKIRIKVRDKLSELFVSGDSIS
jgi:hypothetical protein